MKSTTFWEMRQWSILFLMHIAISKWLVASCPQHCSCIGDHVKCSGLSNTIDEIALPNNTLSLDLSGNDINTLEGWSFSELILLRSLNLSNNNLQVIAASSFYGLSSLQNLDLSNNYIQIISQNALQGLSQLRTLNLSRNLLNCDCKLVFLLHYNWSVGLKCEQPAGIQFDELVQSCNMVSLSPSKNQMVFEMDQLPLECTAQVVDNHSTIMWSKDGQDVYQNENVLIQTSPQIDKLVSRLWINRLNRSDSGRWQCGVHTGNQSYTSSISVIVISPHIHFCLPNRTHTDKGVFLWGKTLQGTVAQLKCPHGSILDNDASLASHFCASDGRWVFLNTSHCQYETPLTRHLQRYSQLFTANMKSPLHWTQIQQVVSQLITPSEVTEVDQVHFVALIVEGLLGFVFNIPESVDTVLSLVSIMFEVDRGLLWKAQQEYQAASRFVHCIEKLPIAISHNHNQGQASMVRGNIAIYVVPLSTASFHGVQCVYNGSFINELEPSAWHCFNSVVNTSATSITIPAKLLNSVRCTVADCVVSVVMYRTTALFPWQEPNQQVVTPVLAVNIDNASMDNSSEAVRLQWSTLPKGQQRQAVYWDFNDKGRLGSWLVDENCQLSGLIISCQRLANYAVMQRNEKLSTTHWLLHSPVVYTASCVLLLALLPITLIYMCAYSGIHLAAKLKHCIINTCLSMALLCVIFTVGARAIPPLCQVMGVLIHYFSLSTLLWITVMAYTSYNKLKAAAVRSVDGEDETHSVLGLYLISWGLGLILCGILSAINHMQHYNQKHYCFLTPGAQVFAFYLPAAVLILLTLVFHLCGSCGSPSAAVSLSLPLLTETQGESDSVVPTIASSSQASQLDSVYQYNGQVKGQLCFLLLFILTWSSAMLTVGQPLDHVLLHHDIIYNYTYLFTAIALSAFCVIFFLCGRHDCRKMWSCSGKPEEVQSVASLYSESAAAGHSDCPTHLSLATAVPDYPIFFNPKQNGIARKYWERNRKKKYLEHVNAQWRERQAILLPPDGGSSVSQPIWSTSHNVPMAMIKPLQQQKAESDETVWVQHNQQDNSLQLSSKETSV